MEAFLNERSIDRQFNDIAAVSDAIVVVNRILSRLAELDVEKHVFFDGQMYLALATHDRNFASCFAHIRDKDVRLQFKLLLNDRLGAREWRMERIHEQCPYVWNKQNMVDTCVAELTERILESGVGFLMNFA